jgi:hypothetical protein
MRRASAKGKKRWATVWSQGRKEGTKIPKVEGATTSYPHTTGGRTGGRTGEETSDETVKLTAEL